MKHLKISLLLALVFAPCFLHGMQVYEDYLPKNVSDTSPTPAPGAWRRGMKCVSPESKVSWMGKTFCANLKRKPVGSLTWKSMSAFGDNDCEEYLQDIIQNLTLENLFVSLFMATKLVETKGIEHTSSIGRVDSTGEHADFIEKVDGFLKNKPLTDLGVVAFKGYLKACMQNSKRPEVSTGGKPLHVSLEESKAGRQAALKLKKIYFTYQLAKFSDFPNEFELISDFVPGKNILVEKMRFSNVLGKKILFKAFDNNDVEEYLQEKLDLLRSNPTLATEIACGFHKLLGLKGINHAGLPKTVAETYDLIVELDKILGKSTEMKKVLIAANENTKQPTGTDLGQSLVKSLEGYTTRKKMFNLMKLNTLHGVVASGTYPGIEIDRSTGRDVPVAMVYLPSTGGIIPMSAWDTNNKFEEFLQDLDDGKEEMDFFEFGVTLKKFLERVVRDGKNTARTDYKRIRDTRAGVPDTYDELIDLIFYMEEVASPAGQGSPEWALMKEVLEKAKAAWFEKSLRLVTFGGVKTKTADANKLKTIKAKYGVM